MSTAAANDRHNVEVIRSESDDVLEGISFQALSLQQGATEPTTPQKVMGSANDAGANIKTKRRIVKAIRITSSSSSSVLPKQPAPVEVEGSPLKSNSNEHHVALEARKLPFFSEGGANLRTVSDSSLSVEEGTTNHLLASIDSTTCPSLPPPVPSFASADSSSVGKLKRSRGGSDFMAQQGEASATQPMNRNKRRRMNRNRAMTASEFGSILSQINATDSL